MRLKRARWNQIHTEQKKHRKSEKNFSIKSASFFQLKSILPQTMHIFDRSVWRPRQLMHADEIISRWDVKFDIRSRHHHKYYSDACSCSFCKLTIQLHTSELKTQRSFSLQISINSNKSKASAWKTLVFSAMLKIEFSCSFPPHIHIVPPGSALPVVCRAPMSSLILSIEPAKSLRTFKVERLRIS